MVGFTLLDSAHSKYKAPYNPIQVKTCDRDSGGHIAPCQFDKPVSEESLLVVVNSGCGTVSDRQGNIWSLAVAVPYFGCVPLWYSLNARGGTDTIYLSDTASTAIIAEYPPSLGFDAGSFGTYQGQNLEAPQGSSSDTGVTLPIQTAGPCELLIGWGVSGGPISDVPWRPGAAPGFTVRASEYQVLMLEDSTSSTPGVYITSADWKVYAHWVLGLAAFNMGGCN